MPKLQDVAALAKVGVGTASRAMSGRGYVDPDTRKRILEAADALGYRPNKVAQALRENKTRVVGLLLPDISNEFYTDSAAVLQSVLFEAGFQLVVSASGNDPESEERGLRSLLDHRVDGIIHVPVDARRLLPTGVPIVQLNRHSVPLQTDAVVSDDEFGIEAITDLALQAGHTDLALVIGGADHSTTADRMRGFRNAVDRAGIPEAPKGTAGHRFRILEGDFTSEWGRNAMHAIAGDLPGVVIAASSRIALGVLHACSDLGLSVPGHLSVAAHGNPEWYEVFPPGITSYAPPLAEMGQEAAVRILAKMEAGTGDGTPTTTRLRGEVHHRHSIGGNISAPTP
ncbi:LacI family DNA-binding transcriptional regulator [Rhodococcus sp. NPDC057014]|uniref:LacI family DNA-binding transcriptional regulator n=1 Tax=Rhodococcus sp. NPDC057014 TaxID=3346000 RepID=UPI0036286EA7